MSTWLEDIESDPSDYTDYERDIDQQNDDIAHKFKSTSNHNNINDNKSIRHQSNMQLFDNKNDNGHEVNDDTKETKSNHGIKIDLKCNECNKKFISPKKFKSHMFFVYVYTVTLR